MSDEANIDAEKIIRIPIDMDNKSILIIHDFTGSQDELAAIIDNLQKWMNADDAPVFMLITRGKTRVQLTKVGKRGKHGPRR